jgi:hypothetical protein
LKFAPNPQVLRAVDVVKSVQQYRLQPNIGGDSKSSQKDLTRAPRDVEEYLWHKVAQPDQIIAAVGRWADYKIITMKRIKGPPDQRCGQGRRIASHNNDAIHSGLE